MKQGTGKEKYIIGLLNISPITEHPLSFALHFRLVWVPCDHDHNNKTSKDCVNLKFSLTAFRGTLKGKYDKSKKAAFIKIDGCVMILNIVMITIEMVTMRKCCTTAQFFECSSTCREGIIARCKSSFFVIIIIIIIIIIMTTISSQFEDWSLP